MTQTEFHHAKPVYEYFDGWQQRHLRLPLLRGPAEERAGLRPGARGDVRHPDLGRRRRPGPRADDRRPRRLTRSGPPRRLASLAAREDPRDRHRRPRARAGPARSRATRRSTEVHAAPGNPGIAAVATLHDVDPMDGAAVADAGRRSSASTWSWSGPRRRWSPGSPTPCRERGIACFGPSRRGRPARGLQGVRQGGDGRRRRADRRGARLHARPSEAAAALDEFGPPYVVKDDGLAAGKGVVVTDDRAGGAGARRRRASGCVDRGVPRRPRGLAVRGSADGTTVYPLQPAQDFKRIFDGDAGPEHRRHGRLHAAAVGAARPGRRGARARCCSRRSTRWPGAARRSPGLLYAGLALTSRGLRVVEFNARFGDPETQPLLALLDSPLGALLMGAADRHASRDVARPGLEPRRRGRRGDGQPRATPSPRPRAT